MLVCFKPKIARHASCRIFARRIFAGITRAAHNGRRRVAVVICRPELRRALPHSGFLKCQIRAAFQHQLFSARAKVIDSEPALRAPRQSVLQQRGWPTPAVQSSQIAPLWSEPKYLALRRAWGRPVPTRSTHGVARCVLLAPCRHLCEVLYWCAHWRDWRGPFARLSWAFQNFLCRFNFGELCVLYD